MPYGLNVVFNDSIAYTAYALKAVICPEVPNNEGSFRPVHIHAPEGSTLNCSRSAPVAARHVVGHFAPECVLGALAEEANTIWKIQAAGYWPSGDPFRFVSVTADGMGPRSSKDGPSAAIFPSGHSRDAGRNCRERNEIAAEHPLILRLPGGGGYGDPHDRPQEAVFEDVRNGLVSPQQAEAIYGVVIDVQSWTVDTAATAACRGRS